MGLTSCPISAPEKGYFIRFVDNYGLS